MISKSSLRVFGIRTGAATLVLLLVYFIGASILHHFHKTKTESGHTNLQNVIIERGIILDEIKNIDAKDIAVSVQYSQLLDALKNNSDAYTKLEDEQSGLKKDNPKLAQEVNSVMSDSAGLQEFFDTYSLYQKALSYQPLDDLYDLNATASGDSIKTRIAATSEALTKLQAGQIIKKDGSIEVRKNITVSDQTKQLIRDFNFCLNDALTNQADNQVYKSTIKKCNDAYSRLRESMVVAISKSLEVDTAQDYIKRLKQTISDMHAYFSNEHTPGS